MLTSKKDLYYGGRLGNDPEIKQMQNGKSVARLSVATSESWKDKSTGERKEKTEWHRVVIFNEGLVGVVQKYLKKGAQVYIEGQLNTNKYTDSNGQEKYSTQIVLQGYNSSLTMLDGKNSSSGDSKKLEGSQLPSDDMPDISQDPDDKVPF
ncbi:MAG: single-stranded DNA-binding protein [Proteobacteria bacterium]|nr:single-stranded DNA-binding protein [Candidatus Fonsibacter sp. PEL3]